MFKEPIVQVTTTKGVFYFYECDEEGCDRLAYYSVVGEWRGTNETVVLRLCRAHYKDYLDLLDDSTIVEIITPTHLGILQFHPDLRRQLI